MTLTPKLLGSAYDAPAALSTSLSWYEAKRHMALGALNRAMSNGLEDVVQTMFWELGLIDVNVSTDGDPSPFGGGAFEDFAAHYRISDDTVAYARERATETGDVVLRIHYLTFVLLRTHASGRAWIDLQRELASAFREYVDGCRCGVANDPDGHAGVHIAHALPPLRRLMERSGVMRGSEPVTWAEWFVALALVSREFPERNERLREQQRHRWIATYLLMLTALPPDDANIDVRSRALSLLSDAALYYGSTPLNDSFERKVAEVEAELRKHWGEVGTHQTMIRRSVDALRRRAEFHRGTGNGMLTANFFRQARTLVAEHRQYFTDGDVANLSRAEQAAHAHSVAAGEFAHIRIPFSIPQSQMDLTRSTPAETVTEIVAFAVGSVPEQDDLRSQIPEMYQDAPLRAMIPTTVINRDKVVGQALTRDQNRDLDVECHAMLLARTNGVVIGMTAIGAAQSVGLTPADLLKPLVPLRLDQGAVELIERGCERLISGDFVSAVHILIPRFEDALRQHLRAIGVDTTRFQPDVGGGTSRTDDASLGALMRSALPDGRNIRDYLGTDLWAHIDGTLNSQTGLNLRNDVAHGLIRPAACSVEIAGLALGLLYQLATVAADSSGVAPNDRGLSGGS